MKTIIIGKESLLTKYLHNYNKKSIIFSARNHSEILNIAKFVNNQKSVNLILNNFYPSSHINKITSKDYEKFYNQSIIFNAKLFSKLVGNNLKKIVYSSSASVYNSIQKD